MEKTKELRDLYSSLNNVKVIKIKKNEIDRAYNTCGRKVKYIQIFVGKPEGKKPL